jgi:phosphorylase kinase alpha/beta subunit
VGCSAVQATDRLLNLSPFETKNLLHHLVSGQEYRVVEGTAGRVAIVLDTHSLSLTGRSTGRTASGLGPTGLQPEQLEDEEDEDTDRVGLWLRRRLLDGSLNRVPAGFYTRLWDLLDRCRGLQVGTEVLDASVCQEMTSGEMDFHLKCEKLLNSVPEPEFRQLVVEALLVLVLVVEHKVALRLGFDVIRVEDIVRAANALFLEDQRKQEGDALLCCVGQPGQCGGAAGICRHFYDSAPSGPWGTMAYLVRGACRALDSIPEDGEIDCTIM